MKVPIRIVVDTREKEPYSFSSGGVEAARRKLEAGDYSLAGLEQSLSLERKTLDDFVGTMIHNRERFRAELTQLRRIELALVVVEADVNDILNHHYRSETAPQAVIAAANSITAYYNIPVLFWGRRQQCCLLAENLLKQLWKRFDPPSGARHAERVFRVRRTTSSGTVNHDGRFSYAKQVH